ncbi:unnamed protein product [Camellia sinensis]
MVRIDPSPSFQGTTMDNEEHHHHHIQFELDPVLICLIGVLSGLFIVAGIHCISVCWCRCRQPRIVTTTSQQENESPVANSEGDHQLITVYSYNTKEGGKEGSCCAVCLSEFDEGETVRVLPECSHCFHVLCIDSWLRSNPSCPLCRAGTKPPPPPPPPDHVVVCLPSSGGVPPPPLPDIFYL